MSRGEERIAALEERNAALQRERDQLVAVVDILQEISSSLHFSDILQSIARKLGELFGLDRSSIYLAGGNADVRLMASYEDPSLRNLVVDLDRYPELKRAFESGDTVFIPDAPNEPMLERARAALDGRNVRSIIVVPIRWRASVIGAIFLLAQTPIFDWFVYAGASNWESVAGPRLDIWAQALAGIRDHPLWGMGFGAFGALAGRLYPLAPVGTAPVLEDAHNFYLQTALDFGLAGLVLFLVAVVIVARTAVRLVRSRPSRSLSGLWAAGLLGALVAHALYSLTDAVALGTLAGVPLWFLFGMVIGAAIDRPDISQPAPARLFLGGCLLLAILLSLPMLPVNRRASWRRRLCSGTVPTRPKLRNLSSRWRPGTVVRSGIRGCWAMIPEIHIVETNRGREPWTAATATSEPWRSCLQTPRTWPAKPSKPGPTIPRVFSGWPRSSPRVSRRKP